MRSIVVYDSVHGNTKRIAEAVAAGIGDGARAVRVDAADAGALGDVDLLVIGSPTLGGRPTPAIQQFVDRIPQGAAQKLKVAAFDTRLPTKLVGVFGYAAPRVAEKLKETGGTLQSPPEGFIVKGRSGPLADGEEERAMAWAQKIGKS